jgi:hypothetical protein
MGQKPQMITSQFDQALVRDMLKDDAEIGVAR